LTPESNGTRPSRRAAFLMALTSVPGWLRGSCYALFFFSAFTIAGISGASIALYLAALAHWLREPVRERLPGWLLAGLLLLPAAAVLSALVNPDPLSNLIGLRREYAIFLPLALLPALALVSGRRLLQVWLVPIVIVAAYAGIQYFWGVDWTRPEGHKLVRPLKNAGVFYGKGTFSHHLTFAGYMLVAGVLFAGLAWRDGTSSRRWWALGAFAALAGVAVSLGRSAWIGAAVGLVLVALDFPRRLWLPLLTGAALFVLVGGLWGSGWLQEIIPPGLHGGMIKRITGTSLRKEERLYLWEAALDGIADRPVFGVGYGNDRKYAGEYRKAVSLRHGNYKFSVKPSTHAHNVYLQVAFELGLVGLAAFLLFWGSVIYWARHWIRQAGGRFPFERAMLGASSCALAASMVAGLFENNFFDAEVRTMILLVMALAIHHGLVIRRGLREGTGGTGESA
jgi:O-antigen ligase